MTLGEKVRVITGQIGRCAGNTGAVERLGVPALCLQDGMILFCDRILRAYHDSGPAGVRPAFGQTQFAPETTLAATWDRELIYQSARAMGQEFRDLGVNIALAPVSGKIYCMWRMTCILTRASGGPYGRSPLAGRNYEGFHADPYGTFNLQDYYAVSLTENQLAA